MNNTQALIAHNSSASHLKVSIYKQLFYMIECIKMAVILANSVDLNIVTFLLY